MILLLCKREILSGTAAHLSFVVDAQRAPSRILCAQGGNDAWAWRQFSAMRVYLVVSGGSFPTVISAGSSWRFRPPAATLIRTQCGHDLILQSSDSV